MILLLDSHALLWFLEDNEALSPTARAAIEDGENYCFVSVASAWETALKLTTGKLKLKTSFDSIFPEQLERHGFQILDLNLTHIRATLQLPLHHNDPFDRMLISQALIEDMTLVSCDRFFPDYGVPVIW